MFVRKRSKTLEIEYLTYSLFNLHIFYIFYIQYTFFHILFQGVWILAVLYLILLNSEFLYLSPEQPIGK